jgi:hypothetical protein
VKFEPVLILDAVKGVIAALTAIGIVTISDATTQWIVGVVGAVLTLISTIATRNRVTPVAKTLP